MHAILLPGWIPGVKNYDKVQLLPSSTTNIDVYREYEKAIQAIGECVEKVHSLSTGRCMYPQ